MKMRYFAVLFILTALFSSCNGPVYKSNYSAEDLCNICNQSLQIENAAFGGAEELKQDNLPAVNPQVSICYSASGNNLDEFGIWKTGGEKPRKVAVFLSDSLLERYQENSAFYNSYMPAETPKLKDAEVRVYGNYVVYAILSEEKKKILFQTLEDTLCIKTEQDQQDPAPLLKLFT